MFEGALSELVSLGDVLIHIFLLETSLQEPEPLLNTPPIVKKEFQDTKESFLELQEESKILR